MFRPRESVQHRKIRTMAVFFTSGLTGSELPRTEVGFFSQKLHVLTMEMWSASKNTYKRGITQFQSNRNCASHTGNGFFSQKLHVSTTGMCSAWKIRTIDSFSSSNLTGSELFRPEVSFFTQKVHILTMEMSSS